MKTTEKFDNRGFESNADTIREIVGWLDNRPEYLNDNRSASDLLQEWFNYLWDLKFGE